MHATLRRAATDYAWLLSHGYAAASALKLVGDRHHLTARQRLAVRRATCADAARARRARTMIPWPACAGRRIVVDGYNLLITIETALSGGLVIIGHDGCCRDLAGLHGTYRKVDETRPAVRIIADHVRDAGVAAVTWLLDRPVSNSGRLAALMRDLLAAEPAPWTIELADHPDQRLATRDTPVVTTDSWILDRCPAWINLARDLIATRIPAAWILDLSAETTA